MKPIALMWQLWGKVIAPTNWQQEVVSFSKCFEFTILLLPNLLQTSSEYCKNTADVKLWRDYWYLKYCCHGNASNLNILFLVDFEAIRAFLGGLTWSKTLENLHTHWNPRQLGRRWGWDPGVAQRLYGAPWNTSENLMCSSTILARINMKLGTHIDLIETNNFCTACHGANAQQEVSYSIVFP